MEILECDLGGDFSHVVARAVEVLRKGGIVVNPTDTCYGMAVDVFNHEALNHLYEVKGMPRSKPVSILVGSFEEAKQYGVFSDLAERMAREFWPGPLTLVVPRTDKLPAYFGPDVHTVGLRVIDEPFTLALLKAFGGPLSTTSANHHGMPSIYNVRDLTVKPDLVVDVGELDHRKKPSTVIEFEGNRATIIRQGDLQLDFKVNPANE